MFTSKSYLLCRPWDLCHKCARVDHAPSILVSYGSHQSDDYSIVASTSSCFSFTGLGIFTENGCYQINIRWKGALDKCPKLPLHDLAVTRICNRRVSPVPSCYTTNVSKTKTNGNFCTISYFTYQSGDYRELGDELTWRLRRCRANHLSHYNDSW